MHDLKLLPCAFALLCLVSATAQQQKDWYSLTVKLKPQYDPRPTLCILIRKGEWFETVVETGKTKTTVSGNLEDAKNQVFRLELGISQGDNHHSIVDRRIYELRLGVPAEFPIIQEMSNHPPGFDREVLLIHDSCPGT
jgi:hypothetical protein